MQYRRKSDTSYLDKKNDSKVIHDQQSFSNHGIPEISMGTSSLGRRESIGSHSQISSSTGKNASKSKKYETKKK